MYSQFPGQLKGVIFMGPNEAQIIRVYVREAGGTVADSTLASTANAEVVVEVEAGTTVYNLMAQYSTGLFVKELVSGIDIPFNPVPADGQLDKPPWQPQATQFVYTIAAADLTGHVGHLCRVYAYTLIGGAPPFEASFAESPIFLVTP
jgi:hypothetical protein